VDPHNVWDKDVTEPAKICFSRIQILQFKSIGFISVTGSQFN